MICYSDMTLHLIARAASTSSSHLPSSCLLLFQPSQSCTLRSQWTVHWVVFAALLAQYNSYLWVIALGRSGVLGYSPIPLVRLAKEGKGRWPLAIAIMKQSLWEFCKLSLGWTSPESFDIVESITDNHSLFTQELDNLMAQQNMKQGKRWWFPAPLILADP